MTTAPERIGLVENFGNYALWNSNDHEPEEAVAQYIRADLAQAAIDAARDRALEDAAKVAEDFATSGAATLSPSGRIAAQIRAMKKGNTDA
jgi:hypothetical protein